MTVLTYLWHAYDNGHTDIDNDRYDGNYYISIGDCHPDGYMG